MKSFALPHESFRQIFPFHFGVDPAMRIAGFGPSLAKLLPELAVGAPVADHLTVRRPDIGWNHEAILAHRGNLFVIGSTDGRLTLRGQMEPTEDGCCLFLGSPWLDDPGSMKRLGLSLRDFAVHDSVTQLVRDGGPSVVLLIAREAKIGNGRIGHDTSGVHGGPAQEDGRFLLVAVEITVTQGGSTLRRAEHM